MFGLDLDTVILDKATVCSRHYVSDIYIYMYMHTIIYPAISTFAVQICYTNKFLLYSY